MDYWINQINDRNHIKQINQINQKDQTDHKVKDKDLTPRLQPWNFGPDDDSHLRVAEMVNRLIQYWGNGSWNDLSDRKALHEAKLLKLCCDKAHVELHWYSVLSIDECLRMTSEWYKMFYEGSSHEPYKFCTKQIMEYVERAKERKLNWPD